MERVGLMKKYNLKLSDFERNYLLTLIDLAEHNNQFLEEYRTKLRNKLTNIEELKNE